MAKTLYKVTFHVENASTISNFYPYPNPFSSSTKFVFTLSGRYIPDDLKIQIMTVTGKVVREITKEELGLAREKIAELQEKVDELRNENTSIEEEKKRLTGEMEQLSAEFNSMQQNMKRMNDENKAGGKKLLCFLWTKDIELSLFENY